MINIEKYLHVTKSINNIENINNTLARMFYQRHIRQNNPNELILFSPPNNINVNIIPENHIPPSMTVMSSECIPQKDIIQVHKNHQLK